MNEELLFEEEIDLYALERVLTVERYAWLSLALDMAAVVNQDGQFEDVNVQWERVTGHAAEDMADSYLIEYIHFDDRERALAQMQRLITSDIGSASIFFRFACKDGDFKRLNWNVIFSPDHDCYFCMVKDASGPNGTDALAYRDALTGLANRMAMEDAVPAVMAQSCSLGSGLALLFLDLDGFKQVNDTYGHRAGDALLVKAAQRMTESIGDAGTVYRLGGDEFVAVIEDCDTLRNGVESIAASLIRTLNADFALGGEIAHIGASIGIALAPADASDIEGLTELADQAMYRVKHAGKNGYAFAGGEPVILD